LADPKSEDLVPHQSTRISRAAVSAGQSSYDPRVIMKMFETTETHPALLKLFGMKSWKDVDNPKFHPLFEDASPITHATSDDVPVMLHYSQANEKLPPGSNGGKHIHHPKFGFMLKEKLDPLGVECNLVLREDKTRPDFADFFIRKLKPPE